MTPAEGTLHNSGQFAGRPNRLARARLADRGGDATRPWLLPEGAQDTGELFERSGCEVVSGRSPGAGIKAHVERIVTAEGEPAARRLDLPGRESEVHEDAI